MSAQMDVAGAALRRYFGYQAFRPGQRDVVAAVLSGADTLGVLPTGGGKSLCYQVPALVRSGLTLVISPLISLMKDQVDRLISCGVPAAYLNSTLTGGQVSRQLARAANGELKLLYVAPERFESADLMRWLRRSGISLLAVDEAHCISEWGHEFRPSFRRIAAVSRQLDSPQVMALTATATPAVRADIVRQLDMRNARVIVGGFDRKNLSYAVRECRSDGEKNATLLAQLKAHARPAIVYASTRASVERIAGYLTRTGVPAVAYHAGLDDDRRHHVQETFMQGSVDIIVATNAFGMGIDKPNVRLVVHYAMPGTLEAYYQEAGRAGRDGLASHCVLLHAYKDRFTHEYFIRSAYPPRQAVERVYSELRLLGRDQALPDSEVIARRCRDLASRDVQTAFRFLINRGVLLQQRGHGSAVRVRLLASPARIRRELGDAAVSIERGVLRALWRAAGERLADGALVRLEALPPGLAGRTARTALDGLRARQFVDFSDVGAGTFLAIPGAALDAFDIPWDELARRLAGELGKLEMMQRYAYIKNCRRAFVLRYFGDSRTAERCGGCDNCLPPLRSGISTPLRARG